MTLLEFVLRRNRIIALAAIVFVTLMSWTYVLSGAGMGVSAWETSSLKTALGVSNTTRTSQSYQTTTSGVSVGPETVSAALPGTVEVAMSTMAMPAKWTLGYAGIMVVMWWVMMIAMMLPSAAPAILLYAAVSGRQGEREGTLLPTGVFAWGYIVVWGVFSAAAAGSQWAFEGFGVLSPMKMNATSLLFAASILVAAGLYQLTPVKQACLRHCRSPIHFLMGHWRPGRWGALRMGMVHGAYCLGCCWALMALLFFGGVMNLYWIAGLAVIVLLEKTIRAGDILSKVTGIVLLLWGATFFYKAMA